MNSSIPARRQPHALARAIALALGSACLMQVALAEDVASPDLADARQLDTIVVQSDIVYRDRTDGVAPVLSYDLEYFQRFEPLTVGDLLKRVPSVAFVSDVLEYDGARLRGLDPGYTQILINGKKVPGAGDDRSFFVDRIPAELVERIEIVRSTSANRSGDAMAGALNIVLRDAYEFDGAYVRAGALRFDDGEVKPTYGGVASGEAGGGRLLAGVNVQGRYNPKQKQSIRFEEPGGDFVDREDQTDVRDGTDYSANLSWTREIGDGKLSLSGLYVLTDRTQSENSIEYNDPVSSSRDNLLSVNQQIVDIDQRTLTLGAGYVFGMLGGRTGIDVGYSAFEDDTVDTEEETGYDDDDTPPAFDEAEGVRIVSASEDRELSLSLSHVRELGSAARLEFGVDVLDKDREVARRTSKVDTDVEGAPLPPYADYDRERSTIEEWRVDPYLMLSGRRGALAWETGLRYETTEVDVRADDVAGSNDYAALLPSAHLKFDLGENDRLGLSVGRTVRRPNFNYLLPLTLEEEYGDNDFVGNPALDQETAWGVDLGIEHRLGNRGVIGVNLFHRNVSDLIEIVNTGAPSATALDDFEDELADYLEQNPGAMPADPGYPVFDPGSFVYTARNVGDGRVYGIEFDVSTPLSALGLPDTGVFLNYSWLDSSVDDEFGERRFNDQARYVYNVGFIHDMPDAGVAFGASYRRQGKAQARLLAEEVETRYGADLEAFVEKRFGKDFSIRLTGSNLLDAKKDETFGKFDNGIDQAGRDYDEYELETENAGRVYQLIARYAF